VFLIWCHFSEHILSKFKWGQTFIKINLELLDGYASCEDSTAVVAFQNDYLKRVSEEHEERKKVGRRPYGEYEMDLPPDSGLALKPIGYSIVG